MEYTPGERDYSLLPAPIHVGEYRAKSKPATLGRACDHSSDLPFCAPGKYLRLKRIHFQLPYDVMWLWQHNQVNMAADCAVVEILWLHSKSNCTSQLFTF